VCTGCTAKATRGGINGGGGFTVRSGASEIFIESRFHYISGALDPTTGSFKSSTRFIPVSFGVRF
jgi:hypothetical protein